MNKKKNFFFFFFQRLLLDFKHQNQSIKADSSVCVCFASRDWRMNIWPGACGWGNWAFVVHEAAFGGDTFLLHPQKHSLTVLVNLSLLKSFQSHSSASSEPRSSQNKLWLFTNLGRLDVICVRWRVLTAFKWFSEDKVRLDSLDTPQLDVFPAESYDF